MEIELINADGITLKTKDKYCSEDIDITPKLQTKTTTVNGKVTSDNGYIGLKEVTVNVQTAPTLQSKTVTPTKSQQNVTADSGYDGLSGVTVNAIPDNYVIPTGTVNITTNGTHDVSGKANANVNVPSKEEETKEVDLAMASGNQVITPDSEKVLSQVVVKKPATMLPENIKKDVNIGGVTGTLESGGGGELNIHYGDTAPEDTSKLWIKSEEPSNISFPVVWKPEQIVERVTNTGVMLPTVTNAIAAAAIDTKIYLFGGRDTNGRLNTIQLFDTTNNTIQTLSTTLPTATSAIAAAAVGTKIYLFGGDGTNGWLNTIQLFDTTNNTIQTLSTTLPTAVCTAGIAAVGTKIYLFGGGNYGGAYPNSKVIYQFTIDIPLSSNDIIVTQEYYSRTFKVMKAPTEVEVACKYVYKGDQNLAKFIDAYLYDGANWVNVNTGATA